MTAGVGGASSSEASREYVQLSSITEPEATRAAARCRIYATFALAFEYPDEDFCEDVAAGILRDGLRGNLAAISPALRDGGGWSALADAGEDDALMIEYTRLFEVGRSGPPCPLDGGLYGSTRMQTMEEVVRFYNHFGLSSITSRNELPDHITTELEFLHYLAYREVEAIEAGRGGADFRRAGRDFLARHPGRWVPQLCARIEQQKPMRFFAELARRLAAFLEHDLLELVRQEGPVPPGSARLPDS